ncbi:IS66 family insertion sequence element accessory protein TnpB [Ensifer sp. ENS11]|uniref:IS66 family insertion sequence element accessory protein TnpB n=1 Tax=Ensifer sp. ENS11 TaxID=2769291 RepID=UPI00177FC780|nr:IS66 family insertion sequence element accessory protein TnpB [Ensifer sp. ENS11]MBD9491638.1 IS66 family insertion sequence element accessory protein TnpB [Ensifer sp. ENS11]
MSRRCGRCSARCGVRLDHASNDLRILIASKPVDFRKGINGLAALVSTTLGANPYSGDVYIFRSKRNDRLKMVAWDGSGMVLVTKVLEDRHFTWPAVRDGAVHLSASEMALLLDGLDWTKVEQRPVKRPTKIA